MLDDASPDAMPASVQRQVPDDASPRRGAAHATPSPALPEQSALTRARFRMDHALAVAHTAPAGDIPVGAVVFGPDGEPVAAATNRRQADNDPTAHAEVLALRAAAEKLGRWRLEDCELVVTLEPCVMCAGAAVAARVGSIVFGAWEPKTGACGSYVDVVRAPGALYVPEVRGGVAEYESQRLIHSFFSDLRR
ncbi:nucleoside deaminase [Corynebacterium propinquum]